MDSKRLYEKIMERTVKLSAEDGGCWLYQGGHTKDGYGVIWTGERSAYVHRVVAEHHGMSIDEKTVDHLCFSRDCVRVSHLLVCSASENSRRRHSAAWRAAVAELLDEMNGTRVR